MLGRLLRLKWILIDSIRCMTGVIFGYLAPCVFFWWEKKTQKSLCFRCLVHFFLGGERERARVCQGPNVQCLGDWSVPFPSMFFQKRISGCFRKLGLFVLSLACFIALQCTVSHRFSEFCSPLGPGLYNFFVSDTFPFGGTFRKASHQMQVGGFKYFLFSPLLGENSHFD